MAPRTVFAADIGASGGKCFIGSFNNGSFSYQEIHRFSHESELYFIVDRNGNVTERMFWDDQVIYKNIIKGLLYHRREISDTLDTIGIDTWGSDGIFITPDGDLIGKVYCYRDHRLDSMIDAVKRKIDAIRIYEITGIHFHPFNISNQLLWFITNRKELLGPGCTFLPMPTLFYYYLGNVKQIDSSWASITQLMDAKERKWSVEILDKLGIPHEVMPKIVPPGTVVGELLQPLAATLGLNRAKLTTVGSHDTASAYAAAPVESPDEALIISSGTWSLVGKLIPEPITTLGAMTYNISNEGGIGNIRFLKNCMGTWIVQELRRIWKKSNDREMSWENITQLVKKAPQFTSFIDLDDTCFYNPHNMETEIMEYCRKTGQKTPGDRGTLLRVVYESLAMNYRTANEQISDVCGKESRVIHIVGGGCKNELLNQFTADATGLPVIAGPEEATAIGNIMVQAMGLGIIDSLDVAIPLIRQAVKIKDYKPRNTQIWRKEYERYKKTVV